MMNSYVTFLEYKLVLEAKQKRNAVDPKCEKFLEHIVVSFFRGHALTVTQAMGLNQIGSPATLHRKITELIHKGWISTGFEQNFRASPDYSEA
jgi:hypothetical protein